MSATFERIRVLALGGDVIVSQHAYERLESLSIPARVIAAGADEAVPVEDYPDYHKGPSVLVLQRDSGDVPIHVVWGLRKGTTRPAVIVTVYRPDPFQWTDDFRSRA